MVIPRRSAVPAAKVAVTIEQTLLREVDRWVASGEFPNRSQAVQAALRCLAHERSKRGTLLSELAKLDPEEEKTMAEERLRAEVPWPEY
jgi:Arc/MetJ-type ribon-helix-helix transcriptional regulator